MRNQNVDIPDIEQLEKYLGIKHGNPGEKEINAQKEASVLLDGEWPLSLATCTKGGKTRFVVRCDAVTE